MIEFKLTNQADMHMLSINLRDDQAYLEPNFVQYIKGPLKVIKDLTKKQTLLQYYKHGARSLIPKIEGSGTICCKPILGHFNILELDNKKNHNLICNKNIFVASQNSVQFKPEINLNLQTLLSSLPLRLHKLSGKGKVILYSKGAMQAIELNNEKLSVYAGEVLAYSDTLKISQNISSDGFWGLSQRSQTTLDFVGTGIVYIVPYQNIAYLLANRMDNKRN